MDKKTKLPAKNTPAPKTIAKSGNGGMLDGVEKLALKAYSIFQFKSFGTWISAYFHPLEMLETELNAASLKSAAANLAIVGFMTGIVGVLSGIISLPFGGSFLESNVPLPLRAAIDVAAITALYVVQGFITSGIYFVFAKILGGRGSFTSQTHTVALVMCGSALLAMPFGLFGEIPMLAGAVTAIALIFGLYSLYSCCRVLQKVHEFSQFRAALTVLLPFVLLAIATALIYG